MMVNVDVTVNVDEDVLLSVGVIGEPSVELAGTEEDVISETVMVE